MPTHQIESKQCAVCLTYFSHPKDKQCGILCPTCQKDEANIVYCIKNQRDFKLLLEDHIYKPLYWAWYDETNVRYPDLVMFMKKGILKLARVTGCNYTTKQFYVIILPRYNNGPVYKPLVAETVNQLSVLCSFRTNDNISHTMFRSCISKSY